MERFKMRLTSFTQLSQHRHEFVKPEPAPDPNKVRIRVLRPTRPIKIRQPRVEVHDPTPRPMPGPDCRKPWERVHDAIDQVARSRRLAR